MMMKNARQKYNTLHAPELCSKLMNLFNNPYMILPGYFFFAEEFWYIAFHFAWKCSHLLFMRILCCFACSIRDNERYKFSAAQFVYYFMMNNLRVARVLQHIFSLNSFSKIIQLVQIAVA